MNSEHGAVGANLTVYFQLYSDMSDAKITDAVGTTNDPIELDCSDGDDEKCCTCPNNDVEMKVSCLTSSQPPAKKKQKRGNVRPLHIKLLKTRMHHGSPSHHRVTFREMLGFEDALLNSSGINWLIGCNYHVDWDYLMEVAPELISVPRVTFFFGDSQTSNASWRRACTLPNGGCSVEFVQLKPTELPRSSLNPLDVRIPYGVHHSKMFFIAFADGTLRVIIFTANLVRGDLEFKTQGAYIQDFPLKKDESQATCEFEQDLIAYMNTYQYNRPMQWNKDSKRQTTLVQELQKYDYSTASVVLLPSTPGRHTLDNSRLQGYLKLQKTIQNLCTPRHDELSSQPLICQFSSLGSMTTKWLHSFVKALDVSQRDCQSLKDRLQLIYPTVNEIRTSVEGYQGGGSVPGTKKNTSKDFLRPLYRKWSSPTSTNDLHSPGNVPHIKTYYQLTPDNTGMEWFCLASHNMSRAAWGEQIQSKMAGGCRLFIRHWEMGVIVCPTNVGESKLVPVEGDIPFDAVAIPLPYKMVPDNYSRDDKPWAVDETYTEPDSFGRSYGV